MDGTYTTLLRDEADCDGQVLGGHRDRGVVRNFTDWTMISEGHSERLEPILTRDNHVGDLAVHRNSASAEAHGGTREAGQW